MKIPALIIGALALAGSALALPATTDAASTIAGYLDPVNGTFAPAASQAQLEAAVAAKTLTRTGKITVVINFNIESAIPAGQLINCGANISSSDFPGISNSAGASSALVKAGSTGKCTMVIPFHWSVSKASTPMNVSFSVSTQGTGGAVNSRSANGSVLPFPVPNSNKTITFSVAL